MLIRFYELRSILDSDAQDPSRPPRHTQALTPRGSSGRGRLLRPSLWWRLGQCGGGLAGGCRLCSSGVCVLVAGGRGCGGTPPRPLGARALCVARPWEAGCGCLARQNLSGFLTTGQLFSPSRAVPWDPPGPWCPGSPGWPPVSHRMGRSRKGPLEDEAWAPPP